MAERDPRVQAFLDGTLKRLFIGGQWEEAASGKTCVITNPANGEELAPVAEGDATGRKVSRACPVCLPFESVA